MKESHGSPLLTHGRCEGERLSNWTTGAHVGQQLLCGQARQHAVRMITKTDYKGGRNRRSVTSVLGSKTEVNQEGLKREQWPRTCSSGWIGK